MSGVIDAVRQLFGSIDVAVPEYEVLKSYADFEIRRYPALLRAETSAATENQAFRKLAKYIGVFGTPANVDVKTKKPEAISMTAPVMMNEVSMSFVLPKEFTMENVPQPTDAAIQIKQDPSAVMAVLSFSGYWNMGNVEEKKDELLSKIKSVSSESNEKIVVKSPLEWDYFGYNPPWTLWFLRKNEVVIYLDQK